MIEGEQVLVVPREAFQQAGVFHGLCFEVDRYLDELFRPGVPRFMERAAAEIDPRFKQLIPYVLISHAGSFVSYVRGRRAGESRLAGSRSIGIGGHINPVDDMPLFGDLRDAYFAAVNREVTEEVRIDAAHNDRIVALLNDDSTEVGQVHLGIVHHWALSAPNVCKREQMITQFGFLSVPELIQAQESLESWSRFCLDLLPGLIAAEATLPAS